MTPCGTSSAVPSLYPLEATTSKDVQKQESCLSHLSYTGAYADIYTLALLLTFPFLSNWSMKAEKQEDTEVLYVFMRQRLLQPCGCVVCSPS